MTDDAAADGVGNRFPKLKELEESVEKAKLEQALAEAKAASTKAKLPTLDVEVAKDSVTTGDKVTGLARVLVQMNSVVLADDIADLALDAAWDATEANAHNYVIRVTSDPAILRAADSYRIVQGRLENLEKRFEDSAPTKQLLADRGIDKYLPGPGTAISGVVELAGLASKLFAKDYQVSGREVSSDDLGFDIQMAQRLMQKVKPEGEKLVVELDRILPTPESEIATRIWKLALDAQETLTPWLEVLGVELAEAAAAVKSAETEIVSIDARLLKLTEKVPEKAAVPDAPSEDKTTKVLDLATLMTDLSMRRAELVEQIPELKAEEARAANSAKPVERLLKDTEEFLAFALTPGSNGSPPPITQVARVESLISTSDNAEPTQFLLYGRVIASGTDQTIEVKLGADRWQVVTGSTAEFAFLSAGGKLLRSEVRSALQTSSMRLDKPESLTHNRINYSGLDRNRRT